MSPVPSANVAAVLSVATIALLLGACHPQPGKPVGVSGAMTIEDLARDPAMAEMRLVQHADPAAALAAALARGDRRLLGVATMALEVPGPPQAYELARTKFGVREINGGGDQGINAARRKLIAGAKAYAARYNTLLLRRLNELSPRTPPFGPATRGYGDEE